MERAPLPPCQAPEKLKSSTLKLEIRMKLKLHGSEVGEAERPRLVDEAAGATCVLPKRRIWGGGGAACMPTSK